MTPAVRASDARRAVAEERRARTRPVHAALFATVVMGAGFRLWHLGASKLNYDESFTAMTGRMPFTEMMRHLRLADSHPPLDYLLRAPFARAGVSELFVRLPSAMCSIAALALFAWWMRGRGRTGVFATVIMALAVFQISYGREARMYAELELIGVATAVAVEAWLRNPRAWHAPAVGALTAVALLTHTSGLLLAAGLLTVPGRRRDRDAWRWRIAIGTGGLVWAAVWGRTFLVQARGRHSQWIPHSTVTRAVSVVGSLVSPLAAAAALLVVATVVGGMRLRTRDRLVARTWVCCFAVPVLLAIVCGRFVPVLLARTLTLFAWGAPLALAVVLDAITPATLRSSAVAIAIVVAVMLPAAAHTANETSGPTPALRELAAVARPGDVVAVEPLSKRVELDWSLGVRGRHGPTAPVRVHIARTPALALTGARSTGRVWLLDFSGAQPSHVGLPRCAPDWVMKTYRIECLRVGSRARQSSPRV